MIIYTSFHCIESLQINILPEELVFMLQIIALLSIEIQLIIRLSKRIINYNHQYDVLFTFDVGRMCIGRLLITL